MKHFIIGFCAVLIVVIAHGMDYNDVQKDEKAYVAMVCDGVWPDFNMIEPECIDNPDVDKHGKK